MHRTQTSKAVFMTSFQTAWSRLCVASFFPPRSSLPTSATESLLQFYDKLAQLGWSVVRPELKY